jgi:hypothetical protein
MKRPAKNTQGQFVIIAALLIAVLTLSLAVSVHQINLQRQQLSYKPVQELVLGISGDFERALSYAANVASNAYNTTQHLESSAIAVGSGFLANWTRSVLTAYANTGLNVSIIPQSADFNFYWDQLNDSSYATACYSLDADAYGFGGWIGRSQKTILFMLYPQTIDISNPKSTTLGFSLTQTTGPEEATPISNLMSNNLFIQAHAIGPAWIGTNVTALTYLGGGNYSVTFTPRINTNTLGVILTVSTPDEGILVEAKNYEPLATTTLQSQQIDSLQPTNLGAIQFGDSNYPLSANVTSQAGTYLIRYFSDSGYTFINWTTTANAEVSSPTLNPALVTINGNNTITAFYAPTTSPPPPPPNGTITVGLSSQAWDGSSQNLGNITFGSNNYLLPNTTAAQLQDYALVYSLYNSTYVFLNWTVQGNVLPWNSTDSSTTVTVGGDGNITAFYGPAPFPGSGTPLYLDRQQPRVPVLVSYENPNGGHIPVSSNSPHVELNVTTPEPTTSIYVASTITVYAYLEPRPPTSVKDVTLELGFTYPANNGQYYVLGRGNYTVNSQNLYTLTINVLNGQWTPQYGTGIIPVNSIIRLSVAVDFTISNGFFDFYYGDRWGPTRIVFN